MGTNTDQQGNGTILCSALHHVADLITQNFKVGQEVHVHVSMLKIQQPDTQFSLCLQGGAGR